MHPNDLIAFRDNIAIPRMMELFEKTQISEGTLYINDLQVSFLDGRSCGFDSHIQASGLLYHDGQVEQYQYSETDVELANFLSAHKDCIFLSDGSLRIEDELEELQLNTKLYHLRDCGRFFHQLQDQKDLRIELDPIEFEKMKHLYLTSQKEQLQMDIVNAHKKSALSDQIQSASSRASSSQPSNAKEYDLDEPVF